MTTLLKDIGDYMVSNGLVTWPAPPTTVGTLFFVMVPSPDVCVMIMEYPGVVPVRTMGSSLPVITRPRIQIMARDPSFAAARTKAHDIYKVLEPVKNVTINGNTYLRIEALQEPFFLHTDDSDRYVHVGNYDIWRAGAE